MFRTVLTCAALSSMVFSAMTFSSMVCPTEALAQTSPPDVVRLHDGTFLRGTIVERNTTHVVVMLPTGETRTYEMAQVDYAGPDDQQPRSASQAPPAPAAQNTAHLRVVTDQEGLSLQRVAGTTTVRVATGDGIGVAQVDQYAVICNAPCEVDIPRGTYQLGVAQGRRDAVRAGAPIDLRQDSTLRIAYDDRLGLRVAGWLTFGLGLAAGLALALGGILDDGYQAYVPYYVSAAVVGGLGIAVGMPLAFMFDAAHVELVEAAGVRF